MKNLIIALTFLILAIPASITSVASAADVCEVNQFGIRWTFDHNYTTGQFVNGDYYVIGEPNVTIIGISPASHSYRRLYRGDKTVTGSFTAGETVTQGSSTAIVHSYAVSSDLSCVELNLEPNSGTGTFVVGVAVTGTGGGSLTPLVVDTRVMHGSMINPIPGDQYVPSSLHQGFDSRHSSYGTSYNVAFDVNSSYPLVIPAGSSLVSVVSKAAPAKESFQESCVLTILDLEPDVNSFRPPYCGTVKTVDYNVSDLNYTLLGNLTPVSGAPSLSDVNGYFDRYWLDFWPGSGVRSYHPTNNMPGYDLVVTIGKGALILNCDFNEAEKKPIMIGFVQLGIDSFGVTRAGGTKVWLADGGHGNGRKWPILFAGIVLNDPNMKNIGQKSGDYMYSNGYYAGNCPPDYIHFGEDSQTFYVSARDIYTPPYTLKGKTTYWNSYTPGTVTCTKGNAEVNGVGTLWKTLTYKTRFGALDAEANDPCGHGYTISSIDSNTTLTLSVPYRGEPDDNDGTVYAGLSHIVSDFVYYGHASTASNVEYKEYLAEDLNLPEWGMYHALYPQQDGLGLQGWFATPTYDYRTEVGYGCALSTLIMDAKTLWNHNCMFDYEDRYTAKAHEAYGSWNYKICPDEWTYDMWNVYRASYGPVWPDMNEPNNPPEGDPCLYVSEISHDYGHVTAGDYNDWVVDICNIGNGRLIGSAQSYWLRFTIVGSADFNIGPPDVCHLRIRYSPIYGNDANSIGVISTNTTPIQTIPIWLYGIGDATITVTSTSYIDFNSINLCTGSDQLTIKIENNADADTFGFVSFDDSHFEVIGDANLSLGAKGIGDGNDVCNLRARFTPDAAGNYFATATFDIPLGYGATRPVYASAYTLLPSVATNPSPADGATNVNPYVTLSWTASTDTTSHDIYWGEGYLATVDVNYYSLDMMLEFNTLYYWRVNETDANGTTLGTEWTFTTKEKPDRPKCFYCKKNSY